MKWTFVIQQKLKVATLLGLIMGVVILFNLILQKNISDINHSVKSIYNDRLVPATDMFRVSEDLHGRQLAIEMFLYRNGGNTDKLKAELIGLHKNTFRLIYKFEKTYLVDEESAFLNKFKQQVASYTFLEHQVIELVKNGQHAQAIKLYESSGRRALYTTINQVADLTRIQSTVGDKLVKDTNGIVTISNYLSDIQIILAVLIGVIVTALVVSSKIINHQPVDFKLN